MARYHVGVDVGKDRHHVAIRDIERDTYFKTMSITNDREGFTEFISCLARVSDDKSAFLVGIEACPYGLIPSLRAISVATRWGY